jgi:hypothetical protein
MEFSPRNLSRSLPTDPHSPHACSTPGVYTFSVTWIVLRLLSSLALGYNNRSDQKSLGSVVVTRFLPGVFSFLCTLSLLERIAHRPTTCSSNLNHLSHLERVLYNWRNKPPHSLALHGHTTNGEKQTRLSHRFNNGRWSHGYGYRQGSMHRIDAQTEDVSDFQNQHAGSNTTSPPQST